jgi:hypothetical protein
MLVEMIEIPEVPIPPRILVANKKRVAAFKRAKAKREAQPGKSRLTARSK